ncbi:MAG: maleylpyruvate isomerase N-terminal domain-containing protein [Anaerolineales bacterium]|nr:maleylpyruvate isomerase N-terminal domain-containing protein [Anaerolineales bacterium]
MISRQQALKDQILHDFIETRAQLIMAASCLEAAEQDRVYLGSWSVKDLLAHLVGWDEANLQAAQAVLAGRLPAFYQYRDRNWQAFNALLVAKYRRDDFRELLELVRQSHQQLVDFLQALPAEQMANDYGVRYRGYKVIISRLLQSEIADEQVHLKQIQEAFVK